MTPTNEKELTELFQTAIIGIAPRLQMQGAEGWRLAERETSSVLTTRRFRLVRATGLPRTDGQGVFTSRVVETTFELRVRTEYAVPHQVRNDLVSDDFYQLLETLASLKASDNGLMQVVAVQAEVFADDDGSDNALVDHTFTVYYLRSR